MKKNKNVIIIALLLLISVMSVGYAAFATQQTISGTAEIIGEWNVKITGIEAQYVSEGCDAGEPQFTNSTATFDAKLAKPGDYITYMITIENAGTIDATLDNINFTDDGGSPAITYKIREPQTVLEANGKTILLLQIMYDEETVENPEVKTKTITGVIEYIQK